MGTEEATRPPIVLQGAWTRHTYLSAELVAALGSLYDPAMDLAWRNRVNLVGVIVVAVAAAMAVRYAWICDDAFISFRYARHLVEGHGLVFNPGERVEGMTNLLWTLGCALGLKLGVPAERWSVNWGITFYAASVLLLVLRFRTRHQALPPVPIAALLAAAMPD